ncbi:hypothetical protein BDB01DRAFT_815742 [Pilobolus umbonatus]|nr:hypothetical protein BDB01DRAFT_815742 [Pilobolus umbonatus]
MKLVIITFWLFPDLIKFERQKGSFQVIWLLMILFTLIPGIVYLFLIMITYTDKISPATNYSGMAGWVVALIFWSNLSDELNGVNQERYLFGSIRMPSKFMPILALIFFVILVPDGSFILNLACAGVSYLYVHTKLPKFLFLSNETVIRYEEKPWLRGLTRLPNFVPVDARFNYLPIATHDVDTNTADTTTTSFPGRGYRLGT